jgi:hypothetical protein
VIVVLVVRDVGLAAQMDVRPISVVMMVHHHARPRRGDRGDEDRQHRRRDDLQPARAHRKRARL